MADGSMPAQSKRVRFKPEHRARARDYAVQRISHAEGARIIIAHHYAHGCANTSTESFGLFKAGELVGAALWMPPTRVAAESVDPYDWRRVLSLSLVSPSLRPSRRTRRASSSGPCSEPSTRNDAGRSS